ncbi:uncharacterized protein Triagg1_4662 [Trichoderma aggressivum f. europaeum]|uniref:Uncharacterized protein n=1 Tax=Trichoderma aggressivum f. europaeum TaxID=173218 RepID=A0AAE1M012_9HYPO|nr:hypothetical protein Triagg1_4662 [Trichoderma aggressivum f. europaeum]
MEITGTIKTTIDLLKFLEYVVNFIRRVTGKTKMDEVAKEIKTDLSHLQRFLLDIKQRQEHLPISNQDQTLQGLIKDIKSRINKVQEVLKDLEASHKGHGRILQILSSERQQHHISSLLDKTRPINEPDDLIGMVVELAKEIESELYIVIDGIDESEDDWNKLSHGPLGHMETLLKANSRMWLLLFVLESKSVNMYLWIKYIFIDLRNAGSEREIEEALNRRPDDLNRHYSRMLSSIMMKHKGELVKRRSKGRFTLIIGASRPFTMMELLRAHAFALPLSQQASSYQPNLLKPESVIEACGGFIIADDGVVQLVHTSMREFFLRPSHLWERLDEYDIKFFRL